LNKTKASDSGICAFFAVWFLRKPAALLYLAICSNNGREWPSTRFNKQQQVLVKMLMHLMQASAGSIEENASSSWQQLSLSFIA